MLLCGLYIKAKSVFHIKVAFHESNPSTSDMSINTLLKFLTGCWIALLIRFFREKEVRHREEDVAVGQGLGQEVAMLTKRGSEDLHNDKREGQILEQILDNQTITKEKDAQVNLQKGPPGHTHHPITKIGESLKHSLFFIK